MKLTVFASLFFIVATAWAQPKTEMIESCLVVRVRDGSKELDIRPFCRAVPKVDSPNFAGLYEWAPDFLTLAFDNAERGHAGSLTGVTGNRPVYLVIVPNGSPDVAISPKADGIVIMISSGFLDFTEGLIGGLLIDALTHARNTQFEAPVGMGYDKWLGIMRGFGENNEGAKPPWPGPGKVSIKQFEQVRTLAQVVYQFLFAHELAHIVLKGPDTEPDPMKKEIACDRLAFSTVMKFLQRSQKPPYGGCTIPAAIVDFMVGVQYYERVKGHELGKAFQQPGKAVKLSSIFPARDWRVRANVLTTETERICRTDQTSWLYGPGWEKMVDYMKRVTESLQPGESLPDNLGGAEFATNLTRVIDSAVHKFEPIKGKQLKPYQGVDIFKSTVELPDQEISQIRVPQNGEQAIARFILLEGEDRKEATAKFENTLKAIRKTVPCWWEFEEQRNPLPTVEKRVVALGDDHGPTLMLDFSHNQDDYEVSILVWSTK